MLTLIIQKIDLCEGEIKMGMLSKVPLGTYAAVDGNLMPTRLHACLY